MNQHPPDRVVDISVEDGLVTLTPVGWPDAESVVSEQGLPVRGGTLVFRPDAVAGALPRTLVVQAEPALLWLSAVYGPAAADAVRAASEADSSVRVVTHPEQPALVESLRVLARAEWYANWWPSGDPGDDLQPSLDADVLDVDLGTLGWECGLVLESDAAAATRLGRSTGVLLALLGRAESRTGALRRYVDERLGRAVDATLDCASGPADDLAALAALREHQDQIDDAVRRALAAWPAQFPRPAGERALVAGEVGPGAVGPGAVGTAPALTVRFSTVDWALVPPRSVSGLDLNVALVASEEPGGVRLEVRVEAGDAPVPALVAYLHAGPRQVLVARIDLGLHAGRYSGSAVVPMLGLDDVDRVAVFVVAPTVRRSRYFPDAPLPWLSPARLGRAEADRAFVRKVLRDHLTRAADVGTRPLLCELAWE